MLCTKVTKKDGFTHLSMQKKEYLCIEWHINLLNQRTMGNKLQTVWTFLRNHKYAFVTLVFLLIIGVLDENSFLNRYQNIKQIREMKAEIRNYRDRYEHDTEGLEDLNKNPEAVKRMAREQYFMKTEDEDIFYIMTDSNEEIN